ncbi:hypothetical protein GLOTRDRAFT_123057 [Gloeophyllum trabeum ATCC 11539]|uniref:Uncharacterized protein n=1 Tax=Gloeophyllum trabeum (strain ATCC 11539 / FP-39264 / Madison 617) TaxID=670483 RepID=S7RCL4_GLOTA|nr:uncharacterized protein GLOTRDRAFT_123057 [Gloeophyllum trabeum ATCC 11539]EPQ51950.1 hypothetical protein GLOTRDRAFT_123057 [Gloeophyllum trabeum ATCC 11539]
MATIYQQRAKRWNTNPWLAEWFSNTFEYCHNCPEGKQAFREESVVSAPAFNSVLSKFGPAEGRKVLNICTEKPTPRARSRYANAKGKARLFHLAGYVAEKNLCHPERVLPAVKRRRGESSTAWLADKVRDTMELQRTRPDIFVPGILRRGASTIPSPEILSKPGHYQEFHRTHDAIRSRMYIFTMSYMTWKDAAELFEDLARQGLTTASAIERAYRQDTKLMWRLVTCFAKADFLKGLLWGTFVQIVSWSDHFSKYFKRWRSQDGVAHVEPNVSYITKNGFNKSQLDELVFRSFCDSGHTGAFFENLSMLLEEDPTLTRKFDADVFDAMGDLAIVSEFIVNIRDSAFGQTLCKHMKSVLESDSLSVNDMFPFVCGIHPSKLSYPSVPPSDFWTAANVMVRAVANAWLQVTGSLDLWEPLHSLNISILDPGSNHTLPSVFDAFWTDIDLQLWEMAKALDWPGRTGSVAKKFGLLSPSDPNKPTFLRNLLIYMDVCEGEERKAQSTPAPAPVVDVPLAAPRESVAQSGHAFVKEMNVKGPKAKTRSAGQGKEPSRTQDHNKEEESLESFPLYLPPQFKLGRKVGKIFERLLDPDPETSPDENAPKKGQIRWGDFERVSLINESRYKGR